MTKIGGDDDDQFLALRKLETDKEIVKREKKIVALSDSLGNFNMPDHEIDQSDPIKKKPTIVNF